jgi:Protein of unknown function C-terminus (DUF2399)
MPGPDASEALDAAALVALRAAIADAPLARAALAAILDRREASGRLPQRLTVAVDPPAVTALRHIFSARAVSTSTPGRARLDLTSAPANLAALLYAALDRGPRDPADDRRRLQAELDRGLTALPPPSHPIAAAFLAATRDDLAAARGDLWTLATERGPATALARTAQLVAALAAAATLTEPIRIANFAARVLGDSKALAPGTDLALALARALLAHDPSVQQDVASHHPTTIDGALARALESRGLIRDEAGVLVHAFGPLVYARRGVTFAHVAEHARLGDPSPLSLAQLRGADLVELPVTQISLFENQAPFLDYVERADPARELVVFARGQATWAVVTLLRLCARSGAPVRHAGDLDRSGVLILRSLAARARVPIAPWHMDAATHARFAATAGRPLPPGERDRLDRLLAVDDPRAPAHDLLTAIAATGLWIEQEAISHELWIPPPPHAGTSSTRV